MRTLLAGIILAAGVTFANAGITNNDINLNGLTEAQKAEIIVKTESMKAEGMKPSGISELSEYAEFGKAFGSAIAQTAKELGATANEFINTPVGIIATILIIWKVAGDAILGLVMGMVWFLVAFSAWSYYFKKLVIEATVEVVSVTENGKTTTTKSQMKPTREQADSITASKITFCISLLVILGIGFIIMFS